MRIFLDTANIDQIRKAAKAGVHIATIPYQVLVQMLHHPLTDIGVARFLSDWRRVSPR